MTTRLQPKRPDEVRDHTHDWSAYLGDDTISTSSWTVSGVTKDSEEDTATTSTVWVSAGTAGTVATLTNTIETVGGRSETESFILPIATIDEPVTITEAKAQLRKTDTSEDALIAAYITAARQWVENYTGHILKQQEFVAAFTEFGDFLTIHATPNVVIDSIAYTNADGDVADFAYFAYPSGTNPVKIYPISEWPTIEANSSILVSYTAGYIVGQAPTPLVQAMLLLIGHWYAYRSAVDEGPLQQVPLAVESLCRPYRGAVLA